MHESLNDDALLEQLIWEMTFAPKLYLVHQISFVNYAPEKISCQIDRSALNKIFDQVFSEIFSARQPYLYS